MVTKITGVSLIQDVLETTGTKINDKFYFLPCWFERTDDGMFVMHSLDGNLPKELTDEIEAHRTATNDTWMPLTPYEIEEEKIRLSTPVSPKQHY